MREVAFITPQVFPLLRGELRRDDAFAQHSRWRANGTRLIPAVRRVGELS